MTVEQYCEAFPSDMCPAKAGKRRLLGDGEEEGVEMDPTLGDPLQFDPNDTMGNMTANATEMANDTIVSALDPVVPADEDVSDAGSGRRKLLQDQPATDPPAAPEEPSTEPIGGDDTDTDAGDADDDDDDDDD